MENARSRADEGFSLIEVVVSMLIFAIMSTAVAGLLVKTMKTTAQGSQRQVAANLADSQKEYLLGLPWAQVASSTVQRTVNGAAYTVQTAVNFVPDNSGNACTATSGSTLNAKAINVTVTWPAMGSVTPVRTDTVRPIPMAESGNTKGAVAWQLTDASGTGLRGVTAVLTNTSGATVGTATSDTNGCVLFSDLEAGGYGLTVDQAGYVGVNNLQLLTTSVTVALGKLAVAPAARYSPIGTVQLSLPVTDPQYLVPAGLGAVLSPVDGLGSPQARPACAVGSEPRTTSCLASNGTASRLYPKAYTAYAGICQEAAGGTSVTPVVGGAVPTTTVPLGHARLKVAPGTTGSVAGAVTGSAVKIEALHASSASCSSQTVLLAAAVVPTSTAEVRYALPVGTWTIRVTNSLGNAKDTALAVTTTVPSTATTLEMP
ncbi:prepilin-type N-terminal cleavage/methylation domain-containing protein [Kineococcus auxinigenes]|uniref:prepilin-type N-terminal cleavage/methylation domain-containing protein n=1 Tax=unclassified Kineococcus TaxID=2621656 RepID=UPI003D7EAE30